MMEMKLATEEQLAEIYKRDLAAAFPPAELKPLREMRAELRRGEYRPWCLFEGDEIVGAAFLWTYVPGFCLFDYLCVTSSRRNDGLGSLLIQKLVEAERGNVLFGESEIAAYAPDTAMAERRLGFYRRNGARQACYDTCVFGVPYHTLYWADRTPADEELCAAHQATYRSRFPKLLYNQFIKIPWEPSMGVPKKTPWLEVKEET
ncbi:MAG: GNAT family N-acetyltransferase [Ruminococcaceae bacterium]|nr:GNAT family N-acetyltransferase [Oscillospiraceae bacterium]